ncbi:hypothetical protein GCM10010211_34310 [Streptomyces albospinus]|uniref:Uncharacterized protein n=1 Tax=Streptomyces albospinus TaxID=285515 RepID=A0ABQ2V346_9ACTN|nr:hypothetical protein [Streptomyces albospinus]GGU66179.1 hypothetical protein GCM10010211_34310 [Streptomyces albospinus]
MTDFDPPSARLRLDDALAGVADAFRGETARPEERNCECHWGSAEELGLLKAPEAVLGADLLRRTWQASDWSDHAAVLRRILPELASALVAGRVERLLGLEEVGASFARGDWQEWSAPQAAAVWEFLRAWWLYSLTAPGAVEPAYEVFALCAEASGEVGSWLATWEALDHPQSDRCLAQAIDHWEYELLGDSLPWNTWHDEETMCAELTTWLVRHVPARLQTHAVSDGPLHRVRLLGLTGPARWEASQWPGHRY